MAKKEFMIRHITWSDYSMSISADKCVESAKRNGIELSYASNKWFDPQDTFYDFNKEVLDADRGAGYWLFKPYCIYRTILEMQDGDILIYSDAGVEFVNSVHHIIDKMDEDIFFFTNGFPHVEWCKGDVLASILPITNHDIYGYKHIGPDFKQVQASVIFFRVNETTRNFVKEWLLYCQMPGFIDDSPSKLPNYPTFAEHRHDQAVLTSLAIKYGYKIDHWWPTQYSAHLPRSDRDSYPIMFNHHRKRNNEW